MPLALLVSYLSIPIEFKHDSLVVVSQKFDWEQLLGFPPFLCQRLLTFLDLTQTRPVHPSRPHYVHRIVPLLETIGLTTELH